MRGPELYGRQPQNVRWSADSRWIYFTWLEPGTNWRETPKQFRVRAVAGAKPERVSLQQIDSTGSRFTAGQRSHNGRYAVVEFNGDLYINDLTAGTTQAAHPDRRTRAVATVFDERPRDLLRPQQQHLLDRSFDRVSQAGHRHSAGAGARRFGERAGSARATRATAARSVRVGARSHPRRQHRARRTAAARFSGTQGRLPAERRAGLRLLDFAGRDARC